VFILRPRLEKIYFVFVNVSLKMAKVNEKQVTRYDKLRLPKYVIWYISYNFFTPNKIVEKRDNFIF